MARVLITGGDGFIGRHLTASYLASGDEVVVLARPTAMRPSVEERSATLTVQRLDLNDRDALGAMFHDRPVDMVFHLAAATRRLPQVDMGDWVASIDGDLRPLVNVAAAAASAERPPKSFVRAGSIAEYGARNGSFSEEDPPAPKGSYGSALLAGTAYLEAMAPNLPFPAATARLALTYGPGQSTAFLAARLMDDLPAGRMVTIERPDDRRDLIHVDDVVIGLRKIAGRAGIINLSTGIAPTMRDLAETVLDVTGADPGLVRYGRTTGSPSILIANNQRLRDRLGWQPALTLREGVSRTVAAERRKPRLAVVGGGQV